MKVTVPLRKIILSGLIVIAAGMFLLASLPVESRIEDNTLNISFIIGKKSVDLEAAELIKVSDDMPGKLKRIAGSSVGKIMSGRFRNVETGTIYQVYLCGKGDIFLVKTADRNYLVDGIENYGL